MGKKVVAIVGTYRKGRVIDSAVAEVLKAAEAHDAETVRIDLIDKNIEFRMDCRKCAQEKDTGTRAQCAHNDDVPAILDQVDEADALVLASPVNFFSVTAVMKAFIERLLVYVYWPWGQRSGPRPRIGKPDKKAVALVSSACPAFLARVLIRAPQRLLKTAARCMGAKVRKTLYFGPVAKTEDATLDAGALARAYKAGERLVV